MTDNASGTEGPLIVNILATSYSGATWVNLVLGSHPLAFSVGEIDQMFKLGTPFCTVHGKECPFWGRFDLASTQNPFLQVARLSQRRVLVVNNTRRLLEAQRQAGLRRKFILLVRDGRAVVASTLRKYPATTAWRAARSWARSLRKTERLVRRQPAGDVMHVCYEKLAAEPEAGFRGLCDFVGLEYDPVMREYWKSEHHFLGGNTGTLTPIASRQNAPLARPDAGLLSYRVQARQDSNADFYQKADAAHLIDERWKTELSDRQLRLFALAAGRANRRHGYPRALDRR